MLKRFLSFLLVIVLLLSVSACKQIDTEQPDNGTGNSESAGNTENTDNTESTNNTESSAEQPWIPEAMLIRFLEDTNSNGAITPYDEPVPPGTLPEMWQIPQPSQSRIGETVSIALQRRQKAIPFYYSCTEDGTERLAVFIAAQIPMLMVFETQLGGVAELCKQISAGTAFQGKILAMVNISWEEGNIYAPNVGSSAYQVAAEEFLTDSSALVAGECVGIVGRANDKDNTVLTVVKGGVYANASKGLRDDIDWMKQKFTRCGLTDIMS